MKTIYKIAKLELSTLFYSPIAWFLAIVFLFQASMAYTGNIHSYLNLQDLGGANLLYLRYLTLHVFGPPFGMFSVVMSKIYLYLPLLTMGLISREVSSGTIKLLYSSPIKVSQIVLGKFFAMVGYNLLLIALLGILAISGHFNIKSPDTGVLLSGMLGIFLLLCAYSAIGLFMSCLTSYQIVAAISTLVVFAALEYVGELWQGIDFVRDLTYFLSISQRTNHFLLGLMETKDLLYFVIISALFLAFSIIKLQSDRSTKSFIVIAGRYSVAFVLALALGYISGIPGWIGYLDVTSTNINTLTPNTQKVIAQIGDEPLEITSYVNLLDPHFSLGGPEHRNADLDRWARYLRFKPNIKLNYVYYYAAQLDPNANLGKYYPGKTPKQLAKRFADTYKVDFKKFKTREEINQIIDLRAEQYRNVAQVKFKGKTTFLRSFNDQEYWPGEAEVTAALKRLTVSLPKIAFLQGEYERSIDKLGPHDFGAIANDITFRYALINQGFDVETITLQNQDIPKGISALVIGDPRTAFSPVVLGKIRKYIADGGNLLIAGEPDKKAVLEPILETLGVKAMDGLLLQTNKDNPPDLVKPLLTKAATELSAGLIEPFTDSVGVKMPSVMGLNYRPSNSYRVKPLLMTDAKITWNKKGKAVLDSAAIEYSAVDGDDHSSISTVLALTRNVNGKEQRIIVAGDADFLTTTAMTPYGNSNFAFNTQLFRWFTYGQFPIDTSRPESQETKINLTSSSFDTLKVFLLGILPGIILIFAVIFLIRRKRK
ncbi:Gldg family protein [Mucilaginibacter sp. UYCu711]|uniref:Gldg family protein n=1 Tax=Mucilaginibacter sp. UYCu711 TaxID=3156339 RepID=UPI003D2005D7